MKKFFAILLSSLPTALLLSFLVFHSASNALPARSKPNTPALVRIDLVALTDLERVAASGIAVYARLNTIDGDEYLLALATPDLQAELVEAGLSLRVLDLDSSLGVYYALYEFKPGALQHVSEAIILLAEETLAGGMRRAIARIDPSQAENLPALGLRLHRLGPEPIPLVLQTPSVSLPTSVEPDPTIAGMIAQVNQATVYNYTGDLSGEWSAQIGDAPFTILNRNTYGSGNPPPIQKAAQYVYEHFAVAGLQPGYHYWSGASYPNIIGTLPGIDRPDDILLLTAHLDDMPTASIAPGADDNASGTSAVLVAADILSQYEWDCTLRFVAFTGEEQGLLGSNAYAQMAYNNEDNILGVLNLDMIAYNSDDYPIIELHTRPANTGDLAIAGLFSDVISAYGINLTPQVIQSGITASDHASFWQRGYHAILSIEDFQDFTPYYHTVYDRLSSLDMVYFTEYVKAAVGTFAHMGCLRLANGHLTGVVSGEGEFPVSGAAIQADNGLTLFQTTSGPAGLYHLSLVSGTYTVTASTPGYMPFTASDIQIHSDLTTTLNIALEIIPKYTLSGHVREAYSGMPLSASISALEQPGTSVQTDPATGYYALSLPQGHYTLQAQAAYYLTLTHQIALFEDQILDFDLQPVCLLLVDDDGGAEYENYYIEALEELGYAYTMVSEHPPVGGLEHHSGVIWFTGDQFTQTLTAADQTNLAAYLESGGRLLLSGQDIGRDIGETSFYHDYLHTSLIADIADGTRLSGLDFLQGTVDIFLQGGDGADNQVSPSEVAPVNGGVAVYDYPGQTLYGGVAYSGTYRTVYFSFGFEAINCFSDRTNVLLKVLDFLEACSPPQAPRAGFVAELTSQPGVVKFGNTSSGTSWMNYTWDFGDGQPPSAQANPLHAYAQTGEYTVVLTATNRYGQEQFQQQLGIDQACSFLASVDFDFTPSMPNSGDLVVFTATLTGGVSPFTYTWDFGDGSPPISGMQYSTITHVYPWSQEQSIYIVSLTVSGICSLPKSLEKPVSIYSPPYRIFLTILSKE